MVTIVIPVYKTEKFVNRCVESVVGQTDSDLQILLIDDGSPDGCPRLCDEWAMRDKRITVIHKENAGLGMARNTGIELAAGDYLCFLDSDDYLAPEAIAHARALAERERADVTVFGFTSVSAVGMERSRRIPATEKPVYREEEVQTQFLPKLLRGENGLQMSACWALFSMALVKRAGWRFPSEREVISEDVFALLQLFQHVGSVAVLGEALYYYRQNAGSLTHAYRPDRFAKLKVFYQKTLELCRMCGYPPEVVRAFREPFLSFTIAAMKQERDERRLRAIINDDLLQKLLRGRKKDGFKRRLLFGAMGRKQYALCRLLLAAQRGKDAMGK